MRAEIDVPDINAEEAASLKASIASPDAFRAAGLEYNPAMTSLQATLQRRPDGRAYIRLSSDRAINDPFVDMILEASWSSGRLVRDYTMLFDPPGLRQTAPAAPSQAQIPVQSTASRSAPATLAPVAPLPPVKRPTEPAKITAQAPARPAAAKMPGAASSQVTVKPGDTASKLATATKPPSVSLDQMLVAMLRSNPEAFVGGNINRIKAGSILQVPSEEQAGTTAAVEATQIIVAQSRDFNDFRRKLADNAPSAQLATPERKASGSVQAKVEDKKTGTAAPDKLTLSKGAVQGKLAEEQLASERSAKEAASRTAEIAKNISDLSKLGAASSAVAPGLAASAGAKPAPAAIALSVATPAPAASAAPLAPVTPSASAPQPAASSVTKRPAVAVPPPEPSLVDELIENPLAPAGAIGLIALLAGFGFYRIRQRKNAAPVDSVFLESRLQPDSFFGASGGQSVDTSDSAAPGSAMMYSPSQLDAADDVDPVAEADVYLAYGRDQQAEEILKEALVSNPQRIAIHQKLLEIFAKRRDTKGFEGVATQAAKVTNAQGSEWERICEQGLSIDPGNALYQPGGQPNHLNDSPSRPAPLDFTIDQPDSASSAATLATELQPESALDMDLDLDFSLDEEPVSAISEAIASPPASAPTSVDMDFGLVTESPEPFETTQVAQAPLSTEKTEPTAVDMDFGFVTEAPEPVEPSQSTAIADEIDFALPDLELPSNDLAPPSADNEDFKAQAITSFGVTMPAPLDILERPAPTEPDLGMLEFDLGSLSLDLGEAPDESAATAEKDAHEDPLATKLALAEEFSAIGDDDGARALIEEVISEASGDMKIKAQRALSNL